MHLTEGEKRTACAILSQLLDRVQYLLGEKIEGRRRLHERIATPSERVQREDELSIIVKAVGAERWQRALELQAAQQDGGSLTDEESRFLSSVITEAQRAVNGTGSSVHECPVDIVDFYTAIDKSA
jgi:hypothetical protein